MKLPLLWLHDYCDPGLSAQELASVLALSGTEVDRVHTHGVTALEHFRVGRVLSAERHPDADRLTVCTVDIGTDEAATIVCGAPNVAAGQTVAVASPGRRDARRHEAEAGQAARRALGGDDPRRGRGRASAPTTPGSWCSTTALAARDAARRRAADRHGRARARDHAEPAGLPRRLRRRARGARRDGGAARPAAVGAGPASGGRPIPGFAIEVEDPDLCPRFTARLFEDVTIAPSPPWLKARLMAAGQRPINNVVDITNFVMLLTGQPMHAFDADLRGRRAARRAPRPRRRDA